MVKCLPIRKENSLLRCLKTRVRIFVACSDGSTGGALDESLTGKWGKRCTVALSHQTERNGFKELILLGYVCKRNVCRSQAAIKGEHRLRFTALFRE
mgnify:CR=1 FL=1